MKLRAIFGGLFMVAIIGSAVIGFADPVDVTGTIALPMGGTTCPGVNCINIALNSARGTFAFSTSGLGASGGGIAVDSNKDPACGSSTWINGSLIASTTAGTTGNSETADDSYVVNAAGQSCLRIRVSNGGSGTTTITYNASAATAFIISNGSGGGGGGSVTQGTVPWVVSCGGTPCSVTTPAPLPTDAKGQPFVGTWSEAITGYGVAIATAAPQGNASPLPFVSGATAITLYSLPVSWTASVSTATGCWLNYWDSATIPNPVSTPTGTWGFLTSAAIGSYAAPIPPTTGLKIASGLWVGAYTSPYGGTACNTAANALLVGPALYK